MPRKLYYWSRHDDDVLSVSVLVLVSVFAFASVRLVFVFAFMFARVLLVVYACVCVDALVRVPVGVRICFWCPCLGLFLYSVFARVLGYCTVSLR